MRYFQDTLVFLTFWSAFTVSAGAQPLDRAYPSSQQMVEGGRVDVLVMESGTNRYSVNLPKNYGTTIHLDTGSIVFNCRSNLTVITLQWTTNYPDRLPKMDDLKSDVEARFPDCQLILSFPCVTGLGPGRGFDLVRVAGAGSVLRLRDGYVALPGGSVEFTLNCNAADFDHENPVFLRLLNSFRLCPQPAINSP